MGGDARGQAGPGEEGGRHADSSVGAAEAERDRWRGSENDEWKQNQLDCWREHEASEGLNARAQQAGGRHTHRQTRSKGSGEQCLLGGCTLSETSRL